MPLVEIRSASGNEEADRWTADLHRMLIQYAGHKQWTVDERHSAATPAGLRRVTLEIHGPAAFDRLRWLHGTHRVQRESLASPERIHTSTAMVIVTPLDAETSAAPDSQPGAILPTKATARIRTCNYPQDRITDHRIRLTLHGLDHLVDIHLDRLADALDEAGNRDSDAGR